MSFKLPFRVAEFDEDSPYFVQRNFSEIEHFLNFIQRNVENIGDALSLIDFAPSPGIIEYFDEEPTATHPPLNVIECVLSGEGQMGSIDVAIKTDEYGGIKEAWIIRIINKQAFVEIHDNPNKAFLEPVRTFNIAPIGASEMVDVAIEFTGTRDQYGIFTSDESPHLFWVERTSDYDKIYAVKWDGTGSRPAATLIDEIKIGAIGIGQNIDSTITV